MKRTRKLLIVVYPCVVWSAFFGAQATAQTVYDVPPDTAPNSIAGTDILNLGDGGSIFNSLSAMDDSVINMTGGVTSSMNIRDNATLSLSGGRIGRQIDTDPTANVQIFGAEFTIDGAPVLGLVNPGDRVFINLNSSQTFSGTLTDGSVFAFRGDANDDLSGPIELILDSVPTFAPIVNAPADPLPNGIRSGQQVTLNAGAVLGYNYGASLGSVLNVDGGMIEGNLELIGAELNLNDGTVDGNTDVFLNSTINVSGGLLDDTTRLFDTSSINVIGGMAHNLRLVNNSSLNASSGSISEASLLENTSATITGSVEIGSLAASNNSIASVTGGTIEELNAFDQATVNVNGGVIKIGPEIYGESQLNLIDGTISGATYLYDSSSLHVTQGLMTGRVTAVDSSEVTIEGGVVDHLVRGFTNATVNVSGGILETSIRLSNSATANISGGLLADGYVGEDFSTTNLSGGALGERFGIFDSGILNIDGFDFRVNGVPVSGLDNIGDERLSFVPPITGVFSGRLADGTPFAFSHRTGEDDIYESTIRINLKRSPDVSGPALIQVPTDDAPWGIGSGQTLILEDGGSLYRDFQSGAGSTLIVNGGTVGNSVEAVSSTVTINGGNIQRIEALLDARINVAGGNLRNIDSFGPLITAWHDSEIYMTNGTIQGHVSLLGHSTMTFEGGEITDRIWVFEDATLKLLGGGEMLVYVEERLYPPESESLLLVDGGHLASGSSIETRLQVLSGMVGDSILLRNAFMDMQGGSVGDRLQLTQTVLDISGGNIGNDISAVQLSEINMTGGAIGSGLELFSSSTFNMWDGSIQEFQLFDDSTANIFSGDLPAGFEVNEFATANVYGGSVDGDVILYDEANLLVEGGDFSSSVTLFNASTANISGGTFDEGFFAFDDATINIFGVGFLLNGLPIDGLTEMGDSLVLDVRDGSVLTGFLEDGSFFDIMLSSTPGGADFISESATVMVTVTVPEPGTLVMALVGIAVIPLLTRKARRQTRRV